MAVICQMRSEMRRRDSIGGFGLGQQGLEGCPRCYGGGGGLVPDHGRDSGVGSDVAEFENLVLGSDQLGELAFHRRQFLAHFLVGNLADLFEQAPEIVTKGHHDLFISIKLAGIGRQQEILFLTLEPEDGPLKFDRDPRARAE